MFEDKLSPIMSRLHLHSIENNAQYAQDIVSDLIDRMLVSVHSLALHPTEPTNFDDTYPNSSYKMMYSAMNRSPKDA